MTQATQIMVPLGQLTVDAVNVRKSGREATASFVASIAEKGVIEPMIVRKNGKGYTITNGSKRFAALSHLKETKGTARGVPVTDAFEVPVQVRDETDKEARDTSLITNVIRADMHPAEECEAFAQMVKDGDTPGGIAARYGLDLRRVNQRIALGGKLSQAVRDAWRKDEIDDEDAEAFTLAPDHKSQDVILAKLSKSGRGVDPHGIKQELKIKGDVGQLLEFVGIAEYEKRGGKAFPDLFGTDHRVSDEKLVSAMANEKLEEICAKLIKDGWSWAVVDRERYGGGHYDHGRIESKSGATQAERQKLRELQTLASDYDAPEEASDKAQQEHDALEETIAIRSYTAEQRGKSGCFVKLGHQGRLEIDYGRTKPGEKKKIEAQERATTRKNKTDKAKKSGDSAGVISNALHQRLSEQLTVMVAKTIVSDPALALPAILAGFASGDTVVVHERGLATAKSHGRVTTKFDAAFAGFKKLSQSAQLAKLAEVASTAIDMQVQHTDHKPLKNPANTALIDAMNPAAFNKCARESFDAKDYFASVSKPLCLKAIEEAVNADEARKLAGKPKAEVAKFAVANVGKTKWLPVELRTVHYDGPTGSKKASAPKGKAKKKA